jgi:metallo-beta-lactamase family protein
MDKPEGHAMRIGFYGAARNVTGSKHLLEVNGTRILLDCGLFQGRRAETYENNLNFKFMDDKGDPLDVAEIDMVVLSHAHIDHSGNIPNLVKRGFRGDIICTSATRDLCAAMLADSGHIQQRDAEFVSKKNHKRGLPGVEPIYTQEDALHAMDYFITQGYKRARNIAPGVTLTFHDAGHMLGSAIVVLDIEDRDAHRDVRLVFSGDVGRAGIPIIRDPQTVDRADILIMESTYGDRLHGTIADAEAILEKTVQETYKRGGSIVTPAFAVGRTQQLVYTLHKLSEQGDIPRMPIYVDSPLAVNTTSIYALHPECYDDEIREFVLQPGNINPFGFDDLTYIRSVEESKRLNFQMNPSIIISASGMAEFGRVLHHLKNRIEDRRNTVLINSFQAPHTLGRRLADGEKKVRIFGEEYQVHAQVVAIDGFSGHADYSELLDWVGAMHKKPERVFLVHGEEPAAFAMKQRLEARFGMQVDVPELNQRFNV